MRGRVVKVLRKGRTGKRVGAVSFKKVKRYWKSLNHIERGKWSAQLKGESK